jgi:NAD(P)-dependent dehydrogenase (short-subunit alcohol dehydrogenase family)
MTNPFSLAGKSILITGASSGIGKAIAVESSKMGARIIISGRNEERLNSTFSLLQGKGHQQIIADLQAEVSVNTIVNNLSDIDGIVHCAGIVKPLPFQFINNSVLTEVLRVNFIAPTLLSQQIVKSKKLKKNGSIVFISSISGVICSSKGGSIYSASKGAVNGLVKGMALDLAPRGIRVNCVLPGMIDTDFFINSSITEEQLGQDKKRYPLSRYGRPEEVAYAVIYLLSDASVWMTGSNIIIDGGYTLI